MGLILLAGLSNISPLTSAQFGITLFLGHSSHSRSQHQCLVGAHSLLNSSLTLYHMPSDNSLLPISAVHTLIRPTFFSSVTFHILLSQTLVPWTFTSSFIHSSLSSAFIQLGFIPSFGLLSYSSSLNTYPIIPSLFF
jgi:hypothetical protein